MKSKTLITILLTGVIFFALGFFGKDFYQKKRKIEVPASKTPVENPKQTVDKKPNQNTGFSKILKGKFILKGADYAGFDFVDNQTITWTNEMFPMDPDTMRVKWIDERTFVATFTQKVNDDCPPANWIRKIESYDGYQLVIRNYWTGWGESPDTSEVFYKEN